MSAGRPRAQTGTTPLLHTRPLGPSLLSHTEPAPSLFPMPPWSQPRVLLRGWPRRGHRPPVPFNSRFPGASCTHSTWTPEPSTIPYFHLGCCIGCPGCALCPAPCTTPGGSVCMAMAKVQTGPPGPRCSCLPFTLSSLFCSCPPLSPPGHPLPFLQRPWRPQLGNTERERRGKTERVEAVRERGAWAAVGRGEEGSWGWDRMSTGLGVKALAYRNSSATSYLTGPRCAEPRFPRCERGVLPACPPGWCCGLGWHGRWEGRCLWKEM